MTRRTRGFAKTVKRLILLILAFAAGAATHRAITPISPHDVHVSGDGAAQLAEALFTWPGPERAGDAAIATTQVITVRRWQNLEGLTDIARLCGVACDGRAGVVILRRPSLNGLTRVVLVNLGNYGAGEMLDAGQPMPDQIVACVVQGIETARNDGRVNVTECDVPEHVTLLRPRLWTPRPQ
ncbi:hypothetical protein SAMN05444004_1035 [Jannaschia faecimaris]|uniref:TPM domain-containing protein n=1 Tax=Jannaschia faecimaris TaxID=1244108 RepID=A0A1H3MC77_9RHOB|nr:hypothetical protein [Jannaschia faecimaris]SDY73625.1 hypothetical protein SAMN05444004_1035 [Jannaschia faecimaris]